MQEINNTTVVVSENEYYKILLAASLELLDGYIQGDVNLGDSHLQEFDFENYVNWLSEKVGELPNLYTLLDEDIPKSKAYVRSLVVAESLYKFRLQES